MHTANWEDWLDSSDLLVAQPPVAQSVDSRSKAEWRGFANSMRRLQAADEFLHLQQIAAAQTHPDAPEPSLLELCADFVTPRHRNGADRVSLSSYPNDVLAWQALDAITRVLRKKLDRWEHLEAIEVAVSEFFDRLDTSSDGSVCQPELACGLRGIGVTLLDSQCAALFKSIDTDASGMISSSELQKAVIRHFNEPPAACFDALWKDLGEARRSYLAKCAEAGAVAQPLFIEEAASETVSACLDLKSYKLNDKSGIGLSHGLRYDRSITSVDISDNRLTDVSLVQIVRALNEAEVVKKLDISKNHASIETALELAAFVDPEVRSRGRTGRHQLEDLNVAHLKFGDVAVKELSIALTFNATLVKLDLSHNEIGAAGGTQLAEMVRNNPTLRELDLSWNCLRGAAIQRIGEALAHNRTLTSLSLSWNSVEPAGALALADSLRESKYVRLRFGLGAEYCA